MFFRPFYYPETGCAAYLLGCGGCGVAAVVDPLERDVDAYVSFAETKNMRISHVIETHVHADHRSGARELVRKTGAAHCLHESADVTFPFEPLKDGQVLDIGNTKIEVIHTPGHTPESICLLVRDLRRGPEPWFLLTGDTLFVGAVGRPDLPGHARESAAQLHTSITEKLLGLPETLEVYPAHFAGSACGAGMSGKPMTTLAFEKRWNPTLKLPLAEFVEAVGRDVPAKPPEMETILRFNRGGLTATT